MSLIKDWIPSFCVSQSIIAKPYGCVNLLSEALLSIIFYLLFLAALCSNPITLLPVPVSLDFS